MTGLTITDLCLETRAGRHRIVEGIDLAIEPGRILGVVGESGSGKTSLGLAALGHIRRGVMLGGGAVRVGEASLFELGERQLEGVRGRRISYVSQDPASALNPALRIGVQIDAVLAAHSGRDNTATRRARLVAALDSVSLPATPDVLRRYPHQLSGGQQQRVGLAMALACQPAVLVLDEPTTGLDTSTRSHVLDTIRNVCGHGATAVLYISHDLAVVAGIADRIVVMYAGRIVEEGPTAHVLSEPAHPYTRHLVAASPDPNATRPMIGLPGSAPTPGPRPSSCSFAPRCDLVHDACLRAPPDLVGVGTDRRARCVIPFAVPTQLRPAGRATPVGAIPGASRRRDVLLALSGVSAGYNGTTVVHDVSIEIGRGECVAVVGESGSGKSTLVRAIAGLHHEQTGDMYLDGAVLARSSRRRTAPQRRAIQAVFQHPYESLNPRRRVGDSVARPLLLAGATPAVARRRVDEALEQVALDRRFAGRYPDQLSGGELQRVAIARALASDPQLLVCDEITSALDCVIQATIIELLGKLRNELDLSILLVTHDLPLAATIAGRVAVVAGGRIVELGDVATVFRDAEHPATNRSLAPNVPGAAPGSPASRGVAPGTATNHPF